MTTKRKITLVTGGSRGLGKNAATKIAARGLDVIITYQSRKAEADQTVNDLKQLGVNAAALELNVADASTFDTFFNRLSAILKNLFNAEKFDYLVNNAGIGIYTAYTETTIQDFDTLVNIQLKGAFFLTQKALPYLNDGAGIVNVSTGLTRFAMPGHAAYAAMKGAMEIVTKYQAKELGARGIRSNIIAPGAIATDFGAGMVRDNEKVNAYIASVTSLGRAGVPDDIGGVVAFLCTEDARWINAQRIEISGGMFL